MQKYMDGAINIHDKHHMYYSIYILPLVYCGVCVCINPFFFFFVELKIMSAELVLDIIMDIMYNSNYNIYIMDISFIYFTKYQIQFTNH